eukprot:3616764-Ditylum_brightwellii.AAC.1
MVVISISRSGGVGTHVTEGQDKGIEPTGDIRYGNDCKAQGGKELTQTGNITSGSLHIYTVFTKTGWSTMMGPKST